MIISPSYTWVLHLTKIRKAKEKVCIELKGGENARVELPVSLEDRRAGAGPADPEVELGVAHDPGVGVGEGEVAHVRPVVLRQRVWVRRWAFSGVEILNYLVIAYISRFARIQSPGQAPSQR